jgi:prepilin-type N-terminal cleavage/methylation domain-containing protein
MSKQQRQLTRQGFTLIELMIVVAILGVLGALAIPTLLHFQRRSKTGEVSSLINAIYKGNASYYVLQHHDRGMGTAPRSFCTIGSGHAGYPSPSKAIAQPDANMKVAGFPTKDGLRFAYSNWPVDDTSTGLSTCDNTANEYLYYITAWGDLDGDCPATISGDWNELECLSHFVMTVGSNADNQMFHAPGLTVVRELE